MACSNSASRPGFALARARTVNPFIVFLLIGRTLPWRSISCHGSEVIDHNNGNDWLIVTNHNGAFDAVPSQSAVPQIILPMLGFLND
jgi:1-acyl-sn-glycerol-3-phosphate acyltransferase